METTRRWRQARVALLAVLAAVVALVLPTLVAGADETTIAGALLAVAVSALVRAAHETADLRARTTSYRATSRRPAAMVLATRAADPTHHPLRPRAPGTV